MGPLKPGLQVGAHGGSRQQLCSSVRRRRCAGAVQVAGSASGRSRPSRRCGDRVGCDGSVTTASGGRRRRAGPQPQPSRARAAHSTPTDHGLAARSRPPAPLVRPPTKLSSISPPSEQSRSGDHRPAQLLQHQPGRLIAGEPSWRCSCCRDPRCVGGDRWRPAALWVRASPPAVTEAWAAGAHSQRWRRSRTQPARLAAGQRSPPASARREVVQHAASSGKHS